MTLRIEKAAGTGFCYGVKRAIDILKKYALEHGKIEALGAIVHNQQVLQELADVGVSVVDSLDDIRGDTIAIGAHGVGPQVEEEIRASYTNVINTTCPFVKRAHIAARRLARSDFSVIIYGDLNHIEVKGILGWADGKGIATLDDNYMNTLEHIPRCLGILSQTTQIPFYFTRFVKAVIDSALTKDTEIRIIDTICHDIRERQRSTIELAKKVDLMLVIGSRTSANTRHLADLCSTAAETFLVETAEDIKKSLLQDHYYIGVTGGASTSEHTINDVLEKLKSLFSNNIE